MRSGVRSGVFLFSTMVLSASNALAEPISWNTQMNCASDYYAYCSKFTAGSAGCHACMRSNRTKLSKACVGALIDDGVLSSADAASQKAKVAVAKPTANPSAIANAKVKMKSAARAPSSKANAAPVPQNETAELPKRAATSRNADQRTREPDDPSGPRRQYEQPALALDQPTFDALKNRAPQFLTSAEIELSEATAPRQSSPDPR